MHPHGVVAAPPGPCLVSAPPTTYLIHPHSPPSPVFLFLPPSLRMLQLTSLLKFCLFQLSRCSSFYFLLTRRSSPPPSTISLLPLYHLSSPPVSRVAHPSIPPLVGPTRLWSPHAQPFRFLFSSVPPLPHPFGLFLIILASEPSFILAPSLAILPTCPFVRNDRMRARP